MYPYIHTGDSITVVINGKPNVIAASHPNFEQIGTAIKEGRWSAIDDLIDIPAAVKRFSSGELEVFDNEVLFQGEPLHNAAVDRLLIMMNQGFDVKPLVNFLTRVVNNPDPRAVSGLYSWLERGGLPLSPDGCIIAYKLVRNDFMDHYSGKFDHTPGNIVSQPRFKCDSDPNRTCSSGLHFCSAAYLPHYGGHDSKVVLVKVDPADVVAFPHDYNISKGRCCRYEVVQEIDKDTAASFFGDRVVFNTASTTLSTVSDPGEYGFYINRDLEKITICDEEDDYCFELSNDGITDVASWFVISGIDQSRAFGAEGVFNSDAFQIRDDQLLWNEEVVLTFTGVTMACLEALDPDSEYPFEVTRNGFITVDD